MMAGSLHGEMINMSSKATIVWLFIGPCIGGLVGLMVGFIIFSFAQEGYFAKWELLGHPDGTISNLLSYHWGSTYITTSDGKSYWIDLRNCQRKMEPCFESMAIPADIKFPPTSTMCSSFFSRMRQPPYPIIQCASSRDPIGGNFDDEISIALLADGNIWVWEHTSGSMSQDTITNTGICLLTPCVGGVIGLAIVFVLSYRAGMVKNHQSPTPH